MNGKAEQAYFNGNVYTVDPAFSRASAFCAAGGKFLAVGGPGDIEPLCGPGTERIDLKGRTVLPGLIDAHLHVVYTGNRCLELDLYGRTKAQVLELVAEAAGAALPGRWVTGMGWDQTKWREGQFPSKEELDAVSGQVPVCLKRSCGHCSWVNTRALELAGVTPGQTDPTGGEYLRTPGGGLLGIVTDQAQEAFYRVIPAETEEDVRRKTLWAQEAFFRNGLTSVQDMGSPPSTLSLWEDMYAAGELKMRIYAALKIPGRPRSDALLALTRSCLAPGPRVGLFDGRLTVRCYKLVADGSLGARSAWLLEDYTDRPGHRGGPRMDSAAFAAAAREALDRGFQVAAHAIGDAAVRQCLDCYASVLDPRRDCRWRVEHAQVIAPEDLPRFAGLGVIPTCQTVFLGTDRLMADGRLGPERMKTSYAWRALIQAGCRPPNGTDSPVEDLNPFYNMYCAAARKAAAEGPDAPPWYPEQALTRREALLSYTSWAARAAFEEDSKGSIEPGRLADFIVVDRDPMTCSLWDMAHTRILATVVGGEGVYQAT